MICLKIKKTREFMNRFLMTEAFAGFFLVEASVVTAVAYKIDGRIRKDFYTKQEQEEQELPEFISWKSFRPQILQMIRGTHTPLFMKLVLACAPEKADAQNLIRNLLCSVKYENGGVTLTGGVSYQGFSMDKEPEKCWDRELCRLLDSMNLEYEIIG